MEKKLCLECGEKISGRADKKFCGDMCRNAHNNKLNSDTTNYVRNVNNILRRNRRILEELSTDTSNRIAVQKMVDKGFNFYYYTHTSTQKNGKMFTFCYEFGYQALDNHLYLIVKRDVK
ncbi:MAG: hypothetical protein JST26_05310 [Bacteroidetes bacterium]|nr:hypothetical protein [Bacteroidota bacterium]